MQTLRDIGEHAAIGRLREYLPGRSDVVCGPGDDCAIVQTTPSSDYDLLLTSDPVIESTHFDPATPPASVGHKAIGRVLSDIAAMGGTPAWALMDIVAPPSLPVQALDDLCKGASVLAALHNLAIVGGDMAEGPHIEIHTFAVGVVPRNCAVTRSGAKPGDLIFVTGTLGGSRAGKHLSFEPRLREGAWLGEWATSMIDVSDGLATDLHHIVTMSNAGAGLIATALPLSVSVRESEDNTSAIDHALRDGEDFELLFTIPGRRKAEFLSAWSRNFSLQSSEIGSMTTETGRISLADSNGNLSVIEDGGYRHFRPLEETGNG